MRDEASFVEFAEGARARLRRTAYLICGDWELASDHVQEGLIRVYVAWPSLTRAGREHAYARRAVVSAALDHARRRSSREVPTEHHPDRPVTGPTGDLAEGVVVRDALMTSLLALAPRQRACVVLRFVEDLSVEDTAAVLGCTEGTVKSQTSRALASLRSALQGSPIGDLVPEGAQPW
ncbi:SigE family RNA polymerase sigma factor [Nocardioides sp. SOB77]|uniref:SigE family RNA polymerase sigma factor n=1 Tax=Nocardioides oceani TaxID=3058369 RepID=A0ABT8FH82_9ACTN|nr:SigE family RNA polymerase sigma factor [Nocardioides oceani]MDN4174046.1 SigE family RNA polymerase sigma factor [Nocardioides oceani]